MKLRSQNLVEYLLIFALIAVAGYAFMSKIDLKSIKNYVFMRPAQEDTIIVKDNNGNDTPVKVDVIKIEAMTP